MHGWVAVSVGGGGGAHHPVQLGEISQLSAQLAPLSNNLSYQLVPAQVPRPAHDTYLTRVVSPGS